MSSVPTLRTERLVLRSPCEADFPTYARFFADVEASAFYGGPLPEVGAWSRLARDVGHWTLRGYGVWVVERIDTRQTIGACGLYWPGGWPRPELTWWILPEHRRSGFAREASLAAIRFGHEVLGWTQVETHAADANLAAQGLIAALDGTVVAREVFPDGQTRTVYAFPNPDA